jgi:hypothetical protein
MTIIEYSIPLFFMVIGAGFVSAQARETRPRNRMPRAADRTPGLSSEPRFSTRAPAANLVS